MEFIPLNEVYKSFYRPFPCLNGMFSQKELLLFDCAPETNVYRLEWALFLKICKKAHYSKFEINCDSDWPDQHFQRAISHLQKISVARNCLHWDSKRWFMLNRLLLHFTDLKIKFTTFVFWQHVISRIYWISQFDIFYWLLFTNFFESIVNRLTIIQSDIIKYICNSSISCTIFKSGPHRDPDFCFRLSQNMSKHRL